MNELELKIARRHVVREPVRVKRMAMAFDHKDAGEDRGVVVIANTADVDLDSEVVVPSGADTTYFFKNRTIFWNHDYNIPIARLRYASLKGGKWIVNMTFGKGEFASEVRSMVEDGVVTGTSVGFIPTLYGRPTPEETKAYGPHESIVRAWKWLELSVTPLPCNVEAMIGAGEKGLVSKATLAKALPDRVTAKKRVLIVVG